MRDQGYSVYIRLVQENGDVHAASCTCTSGKGGCCKHVASVLFTLWDYSILGLKVIPEALICTQVTQKWNVLSQRRGHSIDAVYFHDLTFEKADLNRDLLKARKRPIVTDNHEKLSATPEFAEVVREEEVKSLATALERSGKCSLLCVALVSNDRKPCNTFQTSCSYNFSHDEKSIDLNDKVVCLTLKETNVPKIC